MCLSVALACWARRLLDLDEASAAIVALLKRTPSGHDAGHIALVCPSALPLIGYLATLQRAIGLERQCVLTLDSRAR